MSNKCPKCKSEKVDSVEYMGTSMLVCQECGYDERDTYDEVPGQRNTQREKTKHSPYKTGGGKRT